MIQAQVWSTDSGFSLVDVPESAAHDRPLVRIDLALVCGSDRHTVSGRRTSPSPSILGHESVGRLSRVPDDLRDVAGRSLGVGDRVVWSVTATCGDCDRCRRGLTAKCRHILKTGHERVDGAWPLSGGYATHLALHPGLALVRVPDNVDDTEAAMSSCALATVMACVEAAGPIRGRRCLVIGAGMLGICAVVVLRRQGAAEIVAVDVSEPRLQLARALGADACTDPSRVDGPYDVVVELSGVASAVEVAFAHADIGATVVLAGSVTPGADLVLDPERVTRSWWTVRGVHNYEPRHLQQAVDVLADRPLALPSVFSEPVPLVELPTLFTTGPPATLLRQAVRP